MRKKVLVTESQYVRLLEIYSEIQSDDEDLKYTHPVSGKQCKIKIAKNNHTDTNWNRYSAVLVCDLYDDGMETVVAVLPVTNTTPDGVKSIVCKNIEKIYSYLDEMMSDDHDLELTENDEMSRWTVIDEPIICDL